MKKISTKVLALIIIVAMSFIFVPQIASAAEEVKKENKFTSFLKKIFVYPFRATQESTEVVTETATKGAKTVAETGKAAAGVATGDITKTKDLVVEPVKGFAETAVTAVEGTVKVPIEAAEEKAGE